MVEHLPQSRGVLGSVSGITKVNKLIINTTSERAANVSLNTERASSTSRG